MEKRKTRWFVASVVCLCLTLIALPSSGRERRGVKKKSINLQVAPKQPDKRKHVSKRSNAVAAVATVNGAAITLFDYDKELANAARMAQNSNQLNTPELKALVLEGLIQRELLYQECQKRGIQTGKEAVEKELDVIKKRFASDKEFNDALKVDGLTLEKLRFNIVKALTITQFTNSQFGQNISVPEEEIKFFYDNNPNQFITPEQVRASHILIKIDPADGEAGKAAALKKIQAAQQRLRGGADFAELAREVSEDPSAPRGGDLDYFGRGQMVKAFEAAAFALRGKGMSGIVETQFGYHIIKATDRRLREIRLYTEVKDNIRQFLSQNKLQTAINAFAAELKETAQITRSLPQ